MYDVTENLLNNSFSNPVPVFNYFFFLFIILWVNENKFQHYVILNIQKIRLDDASWIFEERLCAIIFISLVWHPPLTLPRFSQDNLTWNKSVILKKRGLHQLLYNCYSIEFIGRNFAITWKNWYIIPNELQIYRNLSIRILIWSKKQQQNKTIWQDNCGAGTTWRH